VKFNMEARSLEFIASACSGDLLGGSPASQIRRVSTDSRQVQPGDLFVALPGERFDGHNFLQEVLQRGAAALALQRDRAPVAVPECPTILVQDTRRALGLLAAHYRKDFSLPVVAVGGSNGKTTTKELVASVLRQKFATLWSEASFNNDIGVPLTLLKLEKSHQVAVLEVGTNHPGELAPLVRMCAPNYGVTTSIGREHLEFFGSLEGVALEEGVLAELLPAGGYLFANGDSEWTAGFARRSPATVVRVGFADGNDWRVRSLRVIQGGTTFQVDSAWAQYNGEYRLNLLGRHQVLNALFALALGRQLGLGREEIARGLAQCKPPKMRLQLWEIGGVSILDDAYNANADSMLAALQTLLDLPCQGRRVAVLGDMAELGAHSEAAHEEIGRRAAELGVAQLFAVGKLAPVTARGARKAGLNRVFEFSDVEVAGTALRSFIKPGDAVLLKASRAARFERIAEFLRLSETPRKN
jgi:UDP-N-acetylmuramoyl-tripeptide--D-alanyl-D-alanine ligase